MRACVIEDNSPIVDQRVILVPFNEKDEAHFFCSLLNSSVAFDLLSSYLLLDASTHVLENLAIGSFDPTNDLHTRLAKFSMEAHRNPRKARKVEIGIDELSRAYWGIK